MTDDIHSYDRELYGRLFLNCYQRQALVMLAERVPDVPLLFHRCLISTDDLLDQVVRLQRPKYDFVSRLCAAEDLALIGLVRTDTTFASFAEARPLLEESVSRDGYAIVVGDVFYWPHCPEYRTRHLMHTIILREHHADAGEWSIIDDNPASLLCAYRYPEQIIADGFDNGELREVRSFTVQPYDADAAHRGTRESFSALLADHRDSWTVFSEVEAILDNPWTVRERAVASLYDVFALYQGSRIALRAYLDRAFGDGAARTLLDGAVQQAAAVQNALLLAKVTGTVDPAWLAATCRGLRETEEKLLDRVRTLDKEGA